jgi:hypothetical protein
LKQIERYFEYSLNLALTSPNLPPLPVASKQKATFVGEDDRGRIMILRQHVKPELRPPESLFW